MNSHQRFTLQTPAQRGIVRSIGQPRTIAILSMVLALMFTTLAWLLLATPVYAAGTIYYVKEGGSGDCTGSWANACADLQTALDAATDGTEIWVAAGTYYPSKQTDSTDVRTATFSLKNGVAIYGGFPADNDTATMDDRDWENNVTTLSGDIGTKDDANDNSYHVVSNDSIDNTAILDGFTITAGQADGMRIDHGGGMYNSNSSPMLTNIIFSGNTALYGGGMYNSNSNPTLTNVTFSGNTSPEYGGFGGGMYNINSKPTLTNVIFSDNSVAYSGGGMTNYQSDLTMTNVIFSGNSAADLGGAMYNQKSTPTLTNVIFSGNSAAKNGGAMYNEGSTPTITNVTFAGNSATENGGAMYNTQTSIPTIQNSIFWGNSATTDGDEIYNDNGTPIISYSLIEGSYTGGSWDTSLGTDSGNNLDADPLFVNPIDASNAPTTDGDYRLQAGSPALDVGNNDADIDGAGTQTISDITTDLDGNTRIRNDNVDLGAYEVQSGSSGQDPTDSADSAEIIYVNHAADGDLDGLSWTTAYTDLQVALATAKSGNEIWVATGTYTPTSTSDRTISFTLKSGVAIYGGFAGTETIRSERDWRNNTTTLSGDIGEKDDASDNSYHVVYNSAVNETAILDGFTITGGNADGKIPYDDGGGMYNENGSNPTLVNITFSDNSAADYGGGMSNYNSSPTLTNVTFSNNNADSDGGGMGNYGISNPILTDVTFSKNTAKGKGGGMDNTGGNKPTLTNVTFSENSADKGGGMNNNTSKPTLTNVTFSKNTAEVFGGGIRNYNSSPILTNAIFNDNTAAIGSGMSNSKLSNPILTNVTFSNNAASTYGGGIYNYNNSNPIIQNSILWGNTAIDGNQIYNDISNTPVISYTLIEGSGGSASWDTALGTDEGNNLDADPLFVDAANGDYRLKNESPAADVGYNDYVQDLATDLDGNARVISDTVDLGAYEAQEAYIGKVIYVNYAVDEENPDGTSWMTAYQDIHDALADAISGDEIWVARGTYYPTSTEDRTISFTLKSGVAMYGGFLGREMSRDERDWQANETILSGDIGTKDDTSDNSYHVIYNDGVDDAALLDGFTITAGNAVSSTLQNGGGMYNTGSSPMLTNITFTANDAVNGGGMSNMNDSNPMLTNVTLSENIAQSSGGAMYNENSVPTLTSVTLSNSSAISGGAIFNQDSNPTLTNVVIIGNEAMDGGGGGAIFNSGGHLHLTNATISGNSANNGGAICIMGSSSIEVQNSILWGNTATGDTSHEVSILDTSPITFTSSLVAGSGGSVWDTMLGINGGENLDEDPSFVAPNQGDYRLNDDSPAVDAGNNDYVQDVATDRDGNTRIVTATVDLGAYEIQDTTAPSVTVDLLTTAEVSPTITGTIDDPDATIEVVLYGFYAWWYSWGPYTATNNGDGTWSLNVPEDLPEVTFDVQVSATDSAGNVGNDTTVDELVIGEEEQDEDTTAPVVTVDELSTEEPRPTLTGTVDDPEATIEVIISSDSCRDEPTDCSGMTWGPVVATNLGYSSGTGYYTWRADFSSYDALESGQTYDVQAIATDTAGNVRVDTTHYELEILSPRCYVLDWGGSTNITTREVPCDNDYSYYDLQCSQGSYCGDYYDPGYYDTYDNDPPTVTVDKIETDQEAPTITGSVNERASLTIYLSNGKRSWGPYYWSSDYNNYSYSWSIDIPVNLPDGTYDVQVTARDDYGNTGYDTTIDELVIDLLALDTYYVKVEPVGMGRCQDWDNACDLQTALHKASTGDEIWVAAGTYYPTDDTDRSISFKLKSGVAVYGGFTGDETEREERDWEANATILSGDIGTKDDASDNSNNVVYNIDVDNTAIFDGFTITAGKANTTRTHNGGGMYLNKSNPTLTNIIFTNNSALGYGGGLYIPINIGTGCSNLTLTNVIFSNNTASEGGGLFNEHYLCGELFLTDVTFSGNSATGNAGNGGGMYNNGEQLHLTNVTFSGNSAKNNGGGMYNRNDLNSTLTNVTFRDNSVLNGSGGGLYTMSTYNSLNLRNVTFSGNSATDTGGGMYGGGTLTNVVFSGNSSDNYGGGMYNKGASTLTNVTFSGNKAYAYGGGLYNDGANPTIQNSIFWGNTATDNISTKGYQLSNNNSTPIIRYTLIEGSGGSASWDTELGTDEGNNLDADPLFVNPIAGSNAPTTDGDYRLQEGSPAIDVGNNEYVQDVDKDLDGNSRIFNTTVDLGAYEIAEASYVISGVVKDTNGTAVAGVSITTSGGHTTKTASDGTYSITVPKGSYTLTPTLTSYLFTPVTRSVAVTDADKTGQDFTATKTYAISGVVKDVDGKPVAGVLITASEKYTATTANDGTYRLTDIPAGNYTLTPVLQAYMFDPATRSVQVTTANLTGQDFMANQDTMAPKVTVTTLTTNNPTPTLTGTVDDPTAVITVTVQRVVTTTMVYSKTYTAVNNGDGTWNVDITEKLDDGSYDVVTVATDPMKNSATETTEGALFIDTVKPRVTIKTIRTDSTTPQLTGKLDDPTAVLTVTVDSTVYTATNKGNGTWSLNITDTLEVGTYDVVAVAKDTTGNVGQDTTINELDITDTQATSKLKLEVSSGYSDLQLEWNALTDIRVTRYVIMFGKGTDNTLSEKATVEKTTSYYDSEGLTRGESYCYQVIAQQANGDTVEVSNRSCGTYGSVALQIPDTYAGAGQEATVPVNIRNANGLKIASGSIYLDYDSTVLEFVKVENTAMSEGYMWSDAVHTIDSTTNRVVISAIAFPAPELYGNGSLFWITFKVLGKDDDTSLLNLREFIGGGSGGCEFYTESFETIPLELIDGIFTVGSKYLLGDASGNGTVGAEDALLSLQFASGKKTPTADELVAADVNGNGKVDAGDVTMILYYASHQAWPFPPKQVRLSATDATSPLSAISVTLTIMDVQLLENQTAQASVYATELTDWAGGDFTIAYDPTVIETGSFTVTTTDMTSGFTVDSYDDGQGGLHISLATGTPISGDGAVVALTFKVKATSGSTELVFAGAGLYDVYGRDFETSALQQPVAMEDGVISLDVTPSDVQQKVFIPYIPSLILQ